MICYGLLGESMKNFKFIKFYKINVFKYFMRMFGKHQINYLEFTDFLSGGYLDLDESKLSKNSLNKNSLNKNLNKVNLTKSSSKLNCSKLNKVNLNKNSLTKNKLSKKLNKVNLTKNSLSESLEYLKHFSDRYSIYEEFENSYEFFNYTLDFSLTIFLINFATLIFAFVLKFININPVYGVLYSICLIMFSSFSFITIKYLYPILLMAGIVYPSKIRFRLGYFICVHLESLVLLLTLIYSFLICIN